jgi:hypothetical protein
VKNETLDKLVSKGDIVYYEYQNLDEEGNPGKSSFRNTERLTLLFPSGNRITFDTFCSGSSENTSLIIGELLEGVDKP